MVRVRKMRALYLLALSRLCAAGLWLLRQLARLAGRRSAGTAADLFGMDETQQFYQVLLDAQLFWVRVDTMAPTADAVWHGTPLPNCPVH